jgi:hypothetical protein
MSNLPQPAGVGPLPSATSAKSFSEHAENKMWDLLKNSGSQVGSAYTGDKEGMAVTDCITYVRQVLEYAFNQVGEPEHTAGVRSHFKKGTELAAYLVDIGFSAYYWNPDVRNPRDGQSQHPVSYQQAKKYNTYYHVPISGFIVDYKLTNPPSFLGRLFGGQRAQDLTAFNQFSKVRFSFGVVKGGMHTFLCSYGMIFEVHWNQIAAGLYERSPFYDYEWLDGVVVLPPDSGFSL